LTCPPPKPTIEGEAAETQRMNKIRELRSKAGLGLDEVADAVGVDVVEIALAELGVGLVRFDLGISIARVLDVHPGELFPGVRDLIDEINALGEDEMREAMLEPSRAEALSSAGLDPDLLPWYAIVRFKSGNERRYYVTSSEAGRIRQSLAGPRGGPFVRFLADCRHILLRLDAVADVRFTNRASYAAFDSEESAYEVVMVSGLNPRPERIEVTPDGGDDGDGPRPFAELLEVAAGDSGAPSFLMMGGDDGEDRYVSVDLVEALEVPVGVVNPSIYDDGGGRAAQGAAGLAEMEVMGRA